MTDKNNDKLMVFGYVRVSTENQLENYSIDEQIQRIKAYCQAKDWVLLRVFTDGGYSGGNTDRPALQQMLESIEHNHVDAVVVYKLDRLSRSQKDTLTLIEDGFLAHETDFVSINENFDTSSPFGRAMIGILSVFAQLEKDQITERFTMGRIGRGKAGYYHGGPTPPTGYDYVDGLLVVNEYQSLQVREIYNEFLCGKSINAIFRTMKEKYGGNWSAAKVRTILTNSVYIGKVKFAGVEYDGVHQPLISAEAFQSVHDLLFSSSRSTSFTTAQKTPFRANNLLTGLVFCGRCGARYSGNHGYYKCYSRAKSSKRFIMDPDCKNDNWEITELDSLVVNSIRSLLRSKQSLNNLLSSTGKKPEGNSLAMESRIKEIDAQITKLVDLYQVNGIPMETLSSRVQALNAEKKTLSAEAKRTPTNKTASEFLSAAASFAADFDSSTDEKKRLLVSGLIERVLINGQSVNVKWRL